MKVFMMSGNIAALIITLGTRWWGVTWLAPKAYPQKPKKQTWCAAEPISTFLLRATHSENIFLSHTEYRNIWIAGVSLSVSSDRELLLQCHRFSNLQKLVLFNTREVSSIWQEAEVKSRHLKLDPTYQENFQEFLWRSNNFSITNSA